MTDTTVDEDVQEETEPATESEESPKEEPKDLGDAGKKALTEERAARKAAEREAAKLRRAEEDRQLADKSEVEQVKTRLEAAEKKAADAAARAVKAEIKAAAGDWADPGDAPRFLDDLSKYINDDGDIDDEQIAADLAAVLEAKPHLKKVAEPPKPKAPKPDPSQGSRGGASPRPTSLQAAVQSSYKA